ncbi:lysylphosphatidylglycerol synthase transmembrane domain-containing protein [Sphingobium algorifonticola]|uniref:Flippase-like domain-containing protein n=1 Tax=Sphingobium algorifonticola TaxID=2008318 RepID=A0A437J4A3_9SPHN|nr:lysylphosphatidylglycerol synthase transmembrane domain-containing protein [Sphingobium algorifonticola]RVT39554.1 flippase-like domain-containing protein [Sphingobium algorifonticola]
MDGDELPRVGAEPAGAQGGGWRSWFFGVVIAAALLGAVLHFGEIRNFGRLITRAQPLWLGLAVLLQVSTYASVAAGWSAVLTAAGTPRPLPRLARIAVGKLFADQAVPSAGMGGNILLVDQLCGLGVARGTAVAALLISMIGFYAAYAVFALAMLGLLWLHDKATPLMAGLVTTFLLVALAIPSLALWLRQRGSAPLPPRLERIGVVRALLGSVAQAPTKLLANRRLLLVVTACNALIFLADAGSFFACLRALGQPVSPETAYIALIMASIVATLGPIPLGLGSFEATAVATLRLLGTPVEPAFAGTMLLRLLTLWLPLIPGMIIMRSDLKRRKRPPARGSGQGARHP